MSKQFKRDFNKYIVIKVSDLKLAANAGYDSIRPEDIQALHRIQEHIANTRIKRGKNASLVSVVVEHDWPEYEAVWGMIERRCTTGAEHPVTPIPPKILETIEKLVAKEMEQFPCSRSVDDELVALCAYLTLGNKGRE